MYGHPVKTEPSRSQLQTTDMSQSGSHAISVSGSHALSGSNAPLSSGSLAQGGGERTSAVKRVSMRVLQRVLSGRSSTSMGGRLVGSIARRMSLEHPNGHGGFGGAKDGMSSNAGPRGRVATSAQLTLPPTLHENV